MTGLPDLSRTKAAIEEYDAFDATYDEWPSTQEAATRWFTKLDRLGEAVGVAFGLDTADRNSMDTCKSCIRPGQKEPGAGCEASFVRRMVAKWEAQREPRT